MLKPIAVSSCFNLIIANRTKYEQSDEGKNVLHFEENDNKNNGTLYEIHFSHLQLLKVLASLNMRSWEGQLAMESATHSFSYWTYYQCNTFQILPLIIILLLQDMIITYPFH